MPHRAAERAIDANGNRAAEGLRALEEVARFVLDDEAIALAAKDLRHRVRAAIPAGAIAERDAVGDVGLAGAAGDAPRGGLPALVRANAARVQEALRAAEEFCRIACRGPAAAALEEARYRSYSLELRLLSRLPAWRLWQIRLYVLVDTALTDRPVEVAAAAARGGAGAVQLRAKGLAVRAYRDLAERVAEAVRAAGALFVVNDHAAVARLVGSDALHVGQDDLGIADARAVAGPLCAIGVSAHTAAQAAAAQRDGADYLGLGPMHATATKPHEPQRGPELLDAVRATLAVPSYAIGGLDGARIAALLPRLPHGVAVAGAVCRAADPERATAELGDLLEREDPLLSMPRRAAP
jgi:thiamine-phosphate pyrophosphorylase